MLKVQCLNSWELLISGDTKWYVYFYDGNSEVEKGKRYVVFEYRRKGDFDLISIKLNPINLNGDLISIKFEYEDL